MTCDFEAAFDDPRTQVTLTWVSGQKFGTAEGVLLFDAEPISPTAVVTWTDEQIKANLPFHLAPGDYTITVVPVLGQPCSKSGVAVPAAADDPSLALVRVVPIAAPMGSVVKLKATGFVFTETVHAPIELRDRTDSPRRMWQAGQVSGWNTAELTLTLPTPAEYGGTFGGSAAEQPHTVKLGSSLHRPAFLLLPQALDPCDLSILREQLQAVATFTTTKLGSTAPATDFGPGDTVLATVARASSATSLLTQLLGDPASGYSLATGLRLVDAGGKTVVPPGSHGLSSGSGLVDTVTASCRLPSRVASPAAADPVSYTLQLVAQLTTPATACANQIVEDLQSLVLTVAPVLVPSVLVLFDHKTPPFAGSVNAGDALVFVRPGTIEGLASGVNDATRGDPAGARGAVVTTLTALLETLRLAGLAGWSGLPIPPTSHLDRLLACIQALGRAQRVSVAVARSIPELDKVLFNDGWLWDDHASDWAGSGFLVAPPGTTVTAHDDRNHGGESCRLGVPDGSVMAETPSLWDPANTYTNRLITSGSGNWYNRISSLRWN